MRFLSANVKKIIKKKIYYFKQDQFFTRTLLNSDKTMKF